MRLVRLVLDDLRCYDHVELDVHPGVTLVVGGNGEGKTSLLEAVSWLALARSFRGSPDAAVVRRGAERAVVRAEVERDGRVRRVEAEIVSGGRNRILVNGTPLPRARALGDTLLVTVFSPDDLRLVQGGPAERRLYLDDLLVALTPRAEQARRDVERALRHRNALLKQGIRGPDDEVTLSVWDAQLAAAASALVSLRLRLLDRLVGPVSQAYDELAGGPAAVRLRYESAWLGPDVAADDRVAIRARLEESLATARRRELERRLTLVGPHRDDVALEIGGLEARTQASQGEQRSLALALRLAAHRVITDVVDEAPVLLLDDVFSELDPHRSEALVEHLPVGQALITSAGVLPPGLRADVRLTVHGGALAVAGCPA